MKTLRYAVIFTAFVTCFTAKGQDRIVERDGQVIILQEGQRTDMAIDNRYIYRNDVDTAYALIVGHIYTTQEVEQAFVHPMTYKVKYMTFQPEQALPLKKVRSFMFMQIFLLV